MTRHPRYVSAFELASLNLRNLLAYFYQELKMPPDTIKLHVSGILQSFAVQELYERESPRPPEGQV